MTTHKAAVRWMRDRHPFVDRRYSRAHEWRFDGGAVVPASSSPAVVPVPWSDASAVDPEEALVAALSSCHMLWFLDFAARAGLVVDAYVDAASGTMEHDADGRASMTRVMLVPTVTFGGMRRPDASEVDRLHHDAHEHCDLARSVRADVVVAGTWRHVEA